MSVRFRATICVIALYTVNPAVAQLLNGGFDDAGGSLRGWTTFNNTGATVTGATAGDLDDTDGCIGLPDLTAPPANFGTGA